MSRKKCTPIGGQAVIEGVMMRGVNSMATAVRDEKGNIVVESKYLTPVSKKNKLYRTPFIRGVLNFVGSMVTGMCTLLRSGEVFDGDAEPSKFEQKFAKKFGMNIYDVVMGVSVLFGILLSLALFVFLPSLIIDGIQAILKKTTEFDPATMSMGIGVLFSLLEGIIRIVIFVGYIALTSLMKDVRRTYMYHGAEHKTISCYENDLELTVENARKMTKQHDRCGTSFMFIVMIISVLVISCFSWISQPWLKILVRIALIPVVMGISYEVLKGMAKYDNILVRILKAPGLALQKLTTKEPTDDMLEVAITAFKTVMEMDANPNLKEQRFDTKKPYKKVREEIDEILAKVNADKADGDWIMCQAMGIKRSELEMQSHITESQTAIAKELATKRATGMPLWKVIGNADFYGNEIDINENVLCPRPETEELVENALKEINKVKNAEVLDLCTGSGCIAVAVAKNSDAIVVASDVSKLAIDVAKKNVEKFELNNRINVVESDMFSSIEGKFNFIITNPPYIPSKDIQSLDVEVKDYDPICALDGGIDGLDFYKIIASNCSDYLKENGQVYLECGINQASDIVKLFNDSFDCSIVKDLSNIERIIIAKKVR